MKVQCEKCGREEDIARVIKTLMGENKDWEGHVATLTGVICNSCWKGLGQPPSFHILDGDLIPDNLKAVGDQIAEEHLRDLEADQKSEEEEVLAQTQTVYFNKRTAFILNSPTLGRELVIFKPEWTSPFQPIESLILFLDSIGKNPELSQLMDGFGIQLRDFKKGDQS